MLERTINKALVAITRCHRKIIATHKTVPAGPRSYQSMPVSQLTPVEADPDSGAVIYHLPGTEMWCLLFPVRGAEPVWTTGIKAARTALKDKIRNERVPGAGLRVAVELREYNEDAKRHTKRWLHGELLDIEHPSLARHSRFYHRTKARIKAPDGVVHEVDLGDVVVCNTTKMIDALERAQAAEREAEHAANAARGAMPTIHSLRTPPRKKGHRRDPNAEPAPLDKAFFAKLARSQRRKTGR
jgi:hypothetical protein